MEIKVQEWGWKWNGKRKGVGRKKISNKSFNQKKEEKYSKRKEQERKARHRSNVRNVKAIKENQNRREGWARTGDVGK